MTVKAYINIEVCRRVNCKHNENNFECYSGYYSSNYLDEVPEGCKYKTLHILEANGMALKCNEPDYCDCSYKVKGHCRLGCNLR